MSSNIQNMYRPIPQSLSDSDSEKELQMDPIHTTYIKTNQPRMDTFTAHKYQHNSYPLQNHIKAMKLKKRQKMSLLRKICFVFSIILCFVTIAVFLWLLPCSGDGICPIRVTSWDKNLENVELKGTISLIKHELNHSNNLAILFRRNMFTQDSHNGMASFSDIDSKMLWYKSYDREPIEMKCGLLDVNLDGVTDCLLLEEAGLVALDATNGLEFWYVHNHKSQNAIAKLIFPLIVADMNHDLVKELVTIAVQNGRRNLLIIASGRTGMVLGEYTLNHCSDINHIISAPEKIMYACQEAQNVTFYELTTSDLYEIVTNNSRTLKPIKSNFTNDAIEMMVVKNKHACPNCEVTITLFDNATRKEIFSQKYARSYATKPRQFSFMNSKKNMDLLQGHINGFIVKLWEWQDETTTDKKLFLLNSTVQINFIKERIVIITFNNSNVHVINASMTEITQLCIVTENGKYNCQPDVSNQDESLLVTDLDDDGTQEFVGYSSTFVQNSFANTTKEGWQLVSNIKVFPLEAELPKLYQNTD